MATSITLRGLWVSDRYMGGGGGGGIDGLNPVLFKRKADIAE